MHPLNPQHRHQAGQYFHHPTENPDPSEGGRPGRRGGPHGGPFGGPHGGPRGGHRGGRGRAPRGDVRTAVLLLLAEEPMHGYQLMQAIADRSGGRWTPSPGAIYPALNLLEDEGLVTVAAESGRKVATLTELGATLVADNSDTWPDPFAGFRESPAGPDLRSLLEQLMGATRQVGRAGTTEQVAAAAEILSGARRALYLLLAGEPENEDGSP
jgi:DNA-binding PadR family transcriptional regulator